MTHVIKAEKQQQQKQVVISQFGESK